MEQIKSELDIPTISSKTMCSETGATPRMLGYWVTYGVFKPIGEANPGQGNPRRFDAQQIQKVKILVKLSNVFYGASGDGLSVRHLKQVYDNYEQGELHLGESIYLNWMNAMDPKDIL